MRLAGDALDACRRRVQQDTHGHRGRTGDPLYGARRMLHTGAGLLTDRQHTRLDALFTGSSQTEVYVTARRCRLEGRGLRRVVVPTPSTLETSTCPTVRLRARTLDAFCRLDDLGMTVIGQQLDDGRAGLACQVTAAAEADRWCRSCGAAGRPRDTVVRRLAHVPFGWRPTVLLVRLRRYCCTGCGRVWRQDLGAAAAPRGKLSRDAVLWA